MVCVRVCVCMWVCVHVYMHWSYSRGMYSSWVLYLFKDYPSLRPLVCLTAFWEGVCTASQSCLCPQVDLHAGQMSEAKHTKLKQLTLHQDIGSRPGLLYSTQHFLWLVHDKYKAAVILFMYISWGGKNIQNLCAFRKRLEALLTWLRG